VHLGSEMFRSYEARNPPWVVVVYKHLVPLGPKTPAINNTEGLVTQILESGLGRQTVNHFAPEVANGDVGFLHT
jgi:hypothetical protein